MIKRTTAILFVLLANIVLLVNIAIPHHHHNNEVCFISTRSQTSTETHKHGPTGDKHEHKGDANTGYCILNPDFIVPSKQVKQEYKWLDFTDKWIHYNQFHASTPDQKLISCVQAYLGSIQPPLLFYSYCHYLYNVPGLRAPPIV